MKMHFTIENWAQHGEFIADDISYWVPLMSYFFNESNSIEIHCWTEEEQVNAEIQQQLPELAIKQELYMTIYTGDLTEKIIGFLTQNPVREDGQLKWFSIFLSNHDSHLFSSEHYGTEFYAGNLNMEQIKFIKSVMPDDINLHIWE